MYNSIKTLPLSVFEEIGKTGNLSLLGEGTPEEAVLAWDKINQEFFEEFGYADNRRAHLLSRIRYLNLMRRYYEGDRMAKTLANIELAKHPTGESASYLKTCVLLSKALEMRLDYNSLTVGEFFHYIELANKLTRHD